MARKTFSKVSGWLQLRKGALCPRTFPQGHAMAFPTENRASRPTASFPWHPQPSNPWPLWPVVSRRSPATRDLRPPGLCPSLLHAVSCHTVPNAHSESPATQLGAQRLAASVCPCLPGRPMNCLLCPHSRISGQGQASGQPPTVTGCMWGSITFGPREQRPCKTQYKRARPARPAPSGPQARAGLTVFPPLPSGALLLEQRRKPGGADGSRTSNPSH